jgi:hypothetical protein
MPQELKLRNPELERKKRKLKLRTLAQILVDSWNQHSKVPRNQAGTKNNKIVLIKKRKRTMILPLPKSEVKIKSAGYLTK